ncbi:hypothetical protein THAOC_07823, partial [Thalassiosira oceanica]
MSHCGKQSSALFGGWCLGVDVAPDAETALVMWRTTHESLNEGDDIDCSQTARTTESDSGDKHSASTVSMKSREGKVDDTSYTGKLIM